jgi:membrane-anchored glycerophosphoryl diester phosphodiesterase (GDPDase)
VPSTSFTPQLRPLSIGEVLDAGFRLLRHRFGTLMLCVLAAGLPLSLLRTIIIASTDERYYDVNATPYFDTPTKVIVGQIVAALVFFLGALIATAACFRVISAAYLGEPVKAGQSLRLGVRRVPAMVVASIVLAILAFVVVFVVVFVATLTTVRPLAFLLIPMIIYLGVRWALVWPAIVAERAGPFHAINRSWTLTEQHWWRSFAILLVLALITLVLYFALSFALFAAFSGMDSINEIALATIDTVFNVVVLAVVYPLSAAIITVLYYDTRVRGEGFDLQLLAESIGSDGSRFAGSPPERPETVGGLSAPTPSPVPAASNPGGGFAPPEGPASAP